MEYKKLLLLSTLICGLFNTGFTKPSSDEYEYNADTDAGSDYEYDENNEVNNPKIENETTNNKKNYQINALTLGDIINITVYVGQSIILPCNTPKVTRPVIFWYNGTESNIISQTHTVINQADRINIYNNFSLEISNLSLYDKQKYFWINIDEKIKQEFYLNVQLKNEVPQIKQEVKNQLRIYSKNIDYTGRELVLQDNDSTEFECKLFDDNSDEQDKPILKWSYIKSSRASEQAENHVSRIIDGKVIIDHVTYHHNGDYCCLGDYKHRNSGLPMVCIHVRINYAPKISTHRHHINTKIGETAELYCDHKAEPDATIKWYKIFTNEHHQKNLQQILPNYKYEIKNEKHKEHLKQNSKFETKNRTILHIKDVEQSDLVKYICEGSNEMGIDSVEITVTNAPEKPIFEDIDINGNEVKIHWLVRSLQTITEASIQSKLNNNTKWMSATVFETKKHSQQQHYWKITHQATFPVGKWIVQVRVKNLNGYSSYSSPHEFYIPDEESENSIPDDVVLAGYGGISRTSNSRNTSSATNILIPTVTIGLCILINFISTC